MSKNTIFGEEHFIDTQMIKLVEQRGNLIDNYVFEQMENAIKGTLFVKMPKVEINKEKLKKWVVLCSKLENIEHSELVDMATKKRITDLEAQLAKKEKEIEKLKTKLEEANHEVIEQLDKVKEWCEDNYDTCFDDKINDCKGKVIGLNKVIFNADMSLYEYLDQQINKLKEGK